ncbi:hypothetical protein PINS_up008915 [Pythium insidiosum]|nr:hypothetical protein PINS_up008915 [Pythium insidiosum]
MEDAFEDFASDQEFSDEDEDAAQVLDLLRDARPTPNASTIAAAAGGKQATLGAAAAAVRKELQQPTGDTFLEFLHAMTATSTLAREIETVPPASSTPAPLPLPPSREEHGSSKNRDQPTTWGKFSPEKMPKRHDIADFERRNQSSPPKKLVRILVPAASRKMERRHRRPRVWDSELSELTFRPKINTKYFRLLSVASAEEHAVY